MRRILEHKSSTSDINAVAPQISQASNLMAFFADRKVPSLMELAAVTLIGQHDILEDAHISIEKEFANLEKLETLEKLNESKEIPEKKVNEFSAALDKCLKDVIKNNSLGMKEEQQVIKFINSGLFAELKRETLMLLTKIKKLHRLVLENNLKAVDEFLNAEPSHLLSVLLKTKSINQTYAKGTTNYVVVEGTALMMAIGSEAVGRDGCDLYLTKAHSHRGNTTLKKLALYSDEDPNSPLRYVVEDKDKKSTHEFTIERGNKEGQLNPEHFDKLKNMFQNSELYKKPLNLDHLEEEDQRDAYAALLKITEKRGHTSFVNEEGMVELLQRHLRRALGDEGEHEIAQQTLAQLPDGWEEKEEKEYIADREIALSYRQSIKDSTSNEDPKLIAALKQYRNHFEPKPEAKGIKRTGRYGKTRLLNEMLEMGDKEYFYEWRKDKLYYDTGVGLLQTLAPDNIRQDMAQGLRQILELGKKSNRSLKYTNGDGQFVPTDSPLSGVGFDSWVDCYFGVAARCMKAGLGGAGVSIFRSYVQTKTAVLQKFMPRRDAQPTKESRCVLM